MAVLMIGDVLPMPYLIASPKMIGKLIEQGRLRPERRHCAAAIEYALHKWRDDSAKLLDASRPG